MKRSLQETTDLEVLRELVRKYLASRHEPEAGSIVGITDVVASPDGGHVAFTGTARERPDAPARSAVYLLDVASGDPQLIGGLGCPAWSADGRRLALREATSSVEVLELQSGERKRYEVGGSVECVFFSTDASRLLVGVAEPGADLSGAAGSGVVGGGDGASPGAPYVEESSVPTGWRRLVGIELETGAVSPASPAGWNIWEADACEGGVVAIASEHPGEDSWYGARLVRFASATSSPSVLVSSAVQLALPRCSPSGSLVAYVEAVCSDRSIVAGDLHILEIASGARVTVDTGGADVTSIRWRDDTTLVAAGQRHLATVLGEASADGSWTEHFSGEEPTFGDWYPAVAPLNSSSGRAFVGAAHAYDRPPALTVVDGGIPRALYGAPPDVSEGAGRLETISWQAPDALEVEGILVTPESDGPHPLLILIHGGPIAAYRPSWHLVYGWTPLLVSQGYAVLHPNPRGSGGRGQHFAGMVRGDMGGRDVTDFTSAADALVDRGVADPARIAVAGRSYGGFMACLLVCVDRRFAAAVAMAPVADWFSLHYTTNTPSFDGEFLGDRVDHPSGAYFQKSPVFHTDAVDTPVLIVTGGEDRCTPPSQGIEFHRALSARGKISTLVRYPGEGHHIGSREAESDMLARVLDFLGRYLKRTPAS